METHLPSEIDISRLVASQMNNIPTSALLEEMQEQSELQRCLLPQMPIIEAIEIAALNLPAFGNGVTGDFYEVKTLSDSSIGIIIGDVSGKGPRALPLATYIQGFASAHLQQDTDAGSLLSALNHVLQQKRLNEGNIVVFATAFCGIIDGRNKVFRYSTGGHPPALLVHQGKTQWLSEGGAIIGLLSQPSYPQQCIPLSCGDMLVLYTDGITEACNGDKQFGFKRLSNLVEAHAHIMNAAQLTEQIFREAIAFNCAPLTDDATVMVLRMAFSPN